MLFAGSAHPTPSRRAKRLQLAAKDNMFSHYCYLEVKREECEEYGVEKNPWVVNQPTNNLEFANRSETLIASSLTSSLVPPMMEEPSSTTTAEQETHQQQQNPSAPAQEEQSEGGGGVPSLKPLLPKRKGTSDSGGKKKSPKDKSSGGTKGKKNGARLASPRSSRTEAGGENQQQHKEKEKEGGGEGGSDNDEEVKERRSLEYTRPNTDDTNKTRTGRTTTDGGGGAKGNGLAVPSASKHQRKKSWDHASPVDKAKQQHEGAMKLERRNSRNFEALVLAGEHGSSPRTSIRMRASGSAKSSSGLASPSRTPENHYFVLRSAPPHAPLRFSPAPLAPLPLPFVSPTDPPLLLYSLPLTTKSHSFGQSRRLEICEDLRC
jgi:hypothetical protein